MSSDAYIGYWERALAERIGAKGRADLWRKINAWAGPECAIEPFEIHAQPTTDGRIPNPTVGAWECDCGKGQPPGSAVCHSSWGNVACVECGTAEGWPVHCYEGEDLDVMRAA